MGFFRGVAANAGMFQESLLGFGVIYVSDVSSKRIKIIPQNCHLEFSKRHAVAH